MAHTGGMGNTVPHTIPCNVGCGGGGRQGAGKNNNVATMFTNTQSPQCSLSGQNRIVSTTTPHNNNNNVNVIMGVGRGGQAGWVGYGSGVGELCRQVGRGRQAGGGVRGKCM